MTFKTLSLLAAAALISLSGCGGDNSTASTAPDNPTPPTPPVTPVDPPLPPSIKLLGVCEHPRQGIGPNGLPYYDQQGTHEDELNWVHAFLNETYLWYKELPVGLKPADYATAIDYFNVLKTPAITASGQPKDRFHFTYPSAAWDALNNSGASIGYGLTWVRSTDASKPRVWRLTMVAPGSPADAAGLLRGDQLLSADGVRVEDASGAQAAAFNAALSPAKSGETHHLVLSRGGATLAVDLTAQAVGGQSVQGAKVIDTPSGKVAYMQFLEHSAVAESQLAKTFSAFKDAGVTDLVLDMRYNGGGLISIASELAYMIAGPQATQDKVFERLLNNGLSDPLKPQMFTSVAVGFSAPEPLKSGAALPYLGLKRVTVLTTAGTCSASESVINSLRGVDVEVNLIGGATCGKPYAFTPAPNCGTTYFAIQVQGVNNKGFGDYADGFQPTCQADDDLEHQLGDSSEGLLAAALRYRQNGSCAAPVSAMRQGARPAMQLVRPAIREIAVRDR